MAEFLHVGVPTKTEQPKETYVDDLKVYITNPEDHEFKYEYLRFTQDTPLPQIMQEQIHLAYRVDNLEKYLKEGEVIVEPFQADENMRIAFLIKDGIIFELMEVK